MSIPISLCLYNYVFQIDYFSSVHFSVVLIIIGIGADDEFVWHDYWENSFCIPALKNRPILRLSYVFRQATKAMLVTSTTSAFAFLACTLSDIMPIQSFGYFAATVVPICFLLTVLVQPINYYIYEKYIMRMKCCRRQKKVAKDGVNTLNAAENAEKETVSVENTFDTTIEPLVLYE